ncbi:hypothetical protein CR513_16311, partial [Mucuna pruriens]
MVDNCIRVGHMIVNSSGGSSINQVRVKGNILPKDWNPPKACQFRTKTTINNRFQNIKHHHSANNNNKFHHETIHLQWKKFNCHDSGFKNAGRTASQHCKLDAVGWFQKYSLSKNFESKRESEHCNTMKWPCHSRSRDWSMPSLNRKPTPECNNRLESPITLSRPNSPCKESRDW